MRPFLSAELQKNIKELAEKISEQVYEFCEEESFDTIHPVSDWAECAKCEGIVLNAQELALDIIEKELLAAIRNTGIF